SGLFTEDGAKQLFFWRELGFTFRRYFADDDVALLHGCADSNHARFIQIAQHGFADVRDVTRDFLWSELGVARFEFKFLDVYGGVIVLFHQLLGDQDGVFEVVTAPWHEGHEHITAKCQFAEISAWTVGDDFALQDALAFPDNRLLVDTSVLVRALELGELINVATHLARQLRRMVLTFHAHDDAFGVD